MEQELILQAKAGSRSAFDSLIKLYLPKLHKAAYFFLYNQEEAADICQEAFLKAYSHIQRFDEKRAFYPWLYTILKNLCLNYLKRNARLKPSAREVDSLRSTYADPEEEFLQKDANQRLIEAIKELPEKYREILVLKVFNNLSYLELAETLGIPKGTVMSRLYNARMKLRNILNAKEE